jgi:hypothetical protein
MGFQVCAVCHLKKGTKYKQKYKETQRMPVKQISKFKSDHSYVHD